MRGRIIVRKKPELLDPEGDTIRAALARLGFDDVEQVRVAKVFEVDLPDGGRAVAEARLQDMAEQLLQNPVMEDATVEIDP